MEEEYEELMVLKRIERLLEEAGEIAEQYHRLAVKTILEVEKDE